MDWCCFRRSERIPEVIDVVSKSHCPGSVPPRKPVAAASILRVDEKVS
jgi:hypothetical protein